MTHSRETREALAAVNRLGILCVVAGVALVFYSTKYAPISAVLIGFGLAPIPRWAWRRWRARRAAKS